MRVELSSQLFCDLSAIVGDKHVVVDLPERAVRETEWRGRYRGKTACIIRPANTHEVSAIVGLCVAKGIAVVPQGGNTGMSGGAVPPADTFNLILSLERLNRIREVDVAGNTMTVEAGCTLASIQQEAESVDRLFPMALGSQGSCQIGGNISTNSGGTSVVRYGNMRDLVLGLELVLPDGQVWNGLRKLRKDNTGYDLKQLFIGAEGTLGVITAAVLKLFPHPRQHVVAWVGVAELQDAVDLLGALRASLGDRLCAFEVLSKGQVDLVLRHIPETHAPLSSGPPWNILIDLTDSSLGYNLSELLLATLARELDAGHIADAVIAHNARQSKQFWRLRDSVSEANRKSGYSVSHDTSVPIDRIPAFVEAATAALLSRPSRPQVVAVGHVGDGNIHLVAIFDPAGWSQEKLRQEADAASAAVHQLAFEFDGSISAEHGIGSIKCDELRKYKAPVELELMTLVKRSLDPTNLMNPDKVLGRLVVE